MSGRRALRRASRQGTDLVGLALVVALAAWTLLSASLRQGAPWETVGSLALMAAAYLVGRLTARWSWAVATVLALSVCLWVVSTAGALDGGPLAGPLGYANANAALAVQVGAVALVAAARGRTLMGKLAQVGVSLPALAVAWANGSAAGVSLGLVLLTVGVVVVFRPPHRPAIAIVASAAALAVAVVGQLLVANGIGDDRAAQALSARRVDLWADAADLTMSQPLLGHGPQSFANASPIAASDADTQAAHSALLETSAETGLVGGALLLMIVGWAYLALTRAPDPGPAVVGAAAWTAFSMHALVDYVADFPLVLAVAALALGLAVGPYRQNNSMSPSESDQSASVGGLPVRGRAVSTGPCPGTLRKPSGAPE